MLAVPIFTGNMKILMLIDALALGGAESHVECLARELQKMGNEIVVVSAGGIIAEKLTIVGVKHRCIPDISNKNNKNVGNIRYTPFAESRGAEAQKASFLTRFLVARGIICSIIDEFCPDIVHAHTRRTAFMARGACRCMKIPLVVTVHALFMMDFPKNLLTCYGDMTIAVSEDIREHVAAKGCGSLENIRVISNGV